MEAVKKEEVRYFTQHYVSEQFGKNNSYHMAYTRTRIVPNRDPSQVIDKDCVYFQFWDVEVFELNGVVYPLNGKKINHSPNIILRDLRSSISFKAPEAYDKIEANSLHIDEAIALYEKEGVSKQLRLFSKC